MFLLVLFLICTVMSLLVGGLAAWSDLRGLTIPNYYSAIIGGLFILSFVLVALFGPAHVFAPILQHIIAALIVFAITALLFAARAMGAADSKLLTVFALWVGLHGLPAMLFYMSITGGILALTALGLRKWKPFVNAPANSWAAQVQAGESKVPYGVAILAGAIAAYAYAGYFNFTTLTSFVAGG